MSELRSLAGLARSLVIYYSRPHRIARTARLYARFAGPGEIVFDIGGHVGNRSRALRRTGAKVVTLEPQPLFYRWLKRTLPADVTILPLAAGPRADRAAMAVSSLHPTVSSLRPDMRHALRDDPGFERVVWDRTATVEMTTLDALIETYGMPAFVKIDVEGFEDQVIAGLTRPVPALAFEFLPALREVAEASIRRLEVLGNYRFNLIIGERLRFEAQDWMDGPALRGQIDQAAAKGRSGDVYARLEAR